MKSEQLKKKWQDPAYREHMRRSHLGQKAWNKGKTLSREHRKKLSNANKGKHNSLKTEFKSGRKDSLHFEWKGELASYAAKHHWVARWLGKPKFCEECKTTIAKTYNWANISGKYKRDLKDWKRLCRKCHHKFDNISTKLWNTRKLQ